MKQTIGVLLSSLVVVCLLGTVGCGPSGPSLAAASGTVTLDGKPVEGANVTFISVDNPAAVGNGTTDASGKFTVTTDGKAGAPIGKCNVGIAKGAEAAKTVSEEEAKKMTSGVVDPSKMQKADNKSLLPVKFASPASSGLTADVAAGGPNDFKFDLKE